MIANLVVSDEIIQFSKHDVKYTFNPMNVFFIPSKNSIFSLRCLATVGEIEKLHGNEINSFRIVIKNNESGKVISNFGSQIDVPDTTGFVLLTENNNIPVSEMGIYSVNFSINNQLLSTCKIALRKAGS